MNDETPQIHPIEKASVPKRSIIFGSTIGAVAIVGALFGLTSVAGANNADQASVSAQTESSEVVELEDAELPGVEDLDVDGPAVSWVVDGDDADWGEVPAEYKAFEACVDDIFETNPDFSDESIEWSDELEAEIDEAFASCDELLPEADRLMNEAFQQFDDCVESEMGIDNLDDEDWTDETEAAWETAEAACEELLPQEIRDMEAAFEAFDDCLAENGLIPEDIFEGDFEFEEIPTVSVMDGDEFSIVEFGEGDGSVTITRSNGAFSVEAAGDATVETIDFKDDFEFEGDFDEEMIITDSLPAEFEVCGEHLPAGDAMFGNFAIASKIN